MAISDAYREYVHELLEPLADISTKKMFGGLGVYANGLFIGVADDDVLYLKVDETNRADYEQAGMAPFAPMPGAKPMQYYEVPAEVLEDREQLQEWLEKAISVAASAPPKKRR